MIYILYTIILFAVFILPLLLNKIKHLQLMAMFLLIGCVIFLLTQSASEQIGFIIFISASWIAWILGSIYALTISKHKQTNK